MSSLPLQLQAVTGAYAAMSRTSRQAGARMVAAASAALSSELGVPVEIAARALPGAASRPLGTERLVFDLGACGGAVVADVEARLGCALAALLGGEEGRVSPAAALLAPERAALELLALIALAGVRSEPASAVLAPALVRDGEPATDALTVLLEVAIAGVRGEVRLSVPARAVTALESVADPSAPAVTLPDVRVGAGLCRGAVSLSQEEVGALSVGDVVLLERDAELRQALVFDGGLALVGEADGEVFTMKERTMLEWNGSFPLTLSLEIARVTVSLRDLARVEPGGVLPLQRARDGGVTLRAGDAVIGRGELVDVDGALGVRITAWEDGR